MSNFCKQCIFWKFTYDRPASERMGTCSNVEVVEKIEKDSSRERDQDGILHTEQWFGCVYFRNQHLTITKIEPK